MSRLPDKKANGRNVFSLRRGMKKEKNEKKEYANVKDGCVDA
jgi:hypothetical protein